MDYFISDTHAGHDNIIKFERTQFDTIREHDLFICGVLAKLNLTKDDTLYHLGDFGQPKNGFVVDVFKQLKCQKILIKGNHDNQTTRLQELFDVVSNEPIFYKKRILLSHEPLPVDSGTLNVHGHLHNANLSSPNHLNISLHQANYHVYTGKELLKEMNKLQKATYGFGEEWYKDMYEFNDGRSIEWHINETLVRKLLTRYLKEHNQEVVDLVVLNSSYLELKDKMNFVEFLDYVKYHRNLFSFDKDCMTLLK